LADAIVAAETHGGSAEGSLPVADFVEKFFLPFVQVKKKASTTHFYRATIKRNVLPVIGQLRLRDVRTVHIQRLLDATNLSHGSLLRIKSACSAVFSHARRLGFITGTNPVQGARAEGRRSDFEAVAYSLADIKFFLRKLNEPARTIIATAAFTGLRLSELRGLRWEDYDGRELIIRRAVWRTSVEQTKTAESKATIPVIAPLRRILDAHRQRNGASAWVFAGEKLHRPLNLANIARREILPRCGDRWRGWHGFRRGLATTLFSLGCDPEIASKILRHADSAVTRRHYLVLNELKAGQKAMQKLEALWYRRGTSRNSKSGSRPHKH
jgi:integrase